MDEQKRAKIEELVIELAKKHPEKVKEVWYNPHHLDPEGEKSERDSYFFMCTIPAFDERIFDEMTMLMTKVYRKLGEDICLLPLPIGRDIENDFQRRIYPSS